LRVRVPPPAFGSARLSWRGDAHPVLNFNSTAREGEHTHGTIHRNRSVARDHARAALRFPDNIGPLMERESLLQARPDDAERPSLKGYSLTVTVEDGYYLKAYANPPEGGGIVSYGFQATISRRGVRDSLKALVAAYLEDNGG
jgi:hypothetical protein